MPQKLDIWGDPMPEREDDEGSMELGDVPDRGDDHRVSQRRLFDASNYPYSFGDLQ